jgi:hypothetical protein
LQCLLAYPTTMVIAVPLTHVARTCEQYCIGISAQIVMVFYIMVAGSVLEPIGYCALHVLGVPILLLLSALWVLPEIFL